MTILSKVTLANANSAQSVLYSFLLMSYKASTCKIFWLCAVVFFTTLLCQFDDVDGMCNQFTKTFLELARECILTKTVTVRYNDKPWFTSEIRKEIRIRDRLRKVMLKKNIIETRIFVNIKNREIEIILTKQKSWFSLIVAFQKILISLIMENQCSLPLLINT